MTKGTAVAPVTAISLLERARSDIAAVLPPQADVEKVIRGVRLALAQKPDLVSCDPKTVLFAVMHLARLGLEANTPLRLASLVAFGKECVPMIEFRGYQELARRSGLINHVEARCVVEGDEFSWDLGTAPHIHHKPIAEDRADAKITHVYAVAFPKEGPPIFDVLTRGEVEKARAVSRMKDGDTWKKWYGEMARKTAVRRLCKYLPLSPELAAAVELDTRGETGEIGAPSEIIDSIDSVNQAVADQTKQRAEELKEKLAPQIPSEEAVAAPGPAEEPARAAPAKGSAEPMF
jgi:recombination protein RecT